MQNDNRVLVSISGCPVQFRCRVAKSADETNRGNSPILVVALGSPIRPCHVLLAAPTGLLLIAGMPPFQEGQFGG